MRVVYGLIRSVRDSRRAEAWTDPATGFRRPGAQVTFVEASAERTQTHVLLCSHGPMIRHLQRAEADRVDIYLDLDNTHLVQP